MKKFVVTISALLVTLVVASSAFAYSSPGQPVGYVNDFANILSASDKAQLESQLVEFEKETSNEIVVVTVNNLDGDYIENYAVKLFEEWGIGKAKNDNGVLLLVAPNERELRIEVGYGLEGALPDISSKSIIDNDIVPKFREGDFAAGIALGVESIISATKGEYVPTESSNENSMTPDDWWAIISFIIFFIAPLFSALLASSKSWWLGGILGGVSGVIIGVIAASLLVGVFTTILMALLGLWYDYVVSKYGLKGRHFGGRGGFMSGGGFGSSGGGFGGFGGGSSGGGGASGRW